MGDDCRAAGGIGLEEDTARPDLQVISRETLAGLMEREGRTVLVVDARFGYEYEGGHIRGAVNAACVEDLRRLTLCLPASTHLVFHCEYSECRAPALCRWFRNEDRKANCENFPHLNFPHLYLLKGGYADFYAAFPQLCEPCGYVKMKEDGRKRERKEAWARVKRTYARLA